MDILNRFKKDLKIAKKHKAAKINGKNLKDVLKKLSQQRDEIEKETKARPQIDDTTQMFMRKVLDVWISEGRKIDEEKFWHEVDHFRQFDHPVEYYEID